MASFGGVEWTKHYFQGTEKEEMKICDQIRGRRRITQEENPFISILLKIIGLGRRYSFMSNPLLIP